MTCAPPARLSSLPRPLSYPLPLSRLGCRLSAGSIFIAPVFIDLQIPFSATPFFSHLSESPRVAPLRHPASTAFPYISRVTPLSTAFTHCDRGVCLELRPLPSPGVTRLHRYYGPLRHPSAPGLSLTGVRLIIPITHGASRVACAFPVYMLPPLPRCSGWAYSSLISPSRVSLPRKGRRVGLHIVLFEACSAFTRVAACTLARSPIRDPLSEGFRHFVSSMPAPVASGWSESPGGTCTH